MRRRPEIDRELIEAVRLLGLVAVISAALAFGILAWRD